MKKAAAKTAARKTLTPTSRTGNGADQPAQAAKPAKPADASAKPHKLKLLRDSFTIPRDEYLVIDALKLRAAKLGHISKKSELLRAGLKLLAGLKDAALLEALAAVPSVKTGRPKAKHQDSAGDAATMNASHRTVE